MQQRTRSIALLSAPGLLAALPMSAEASHGCMDYAAVLDDPSPNAHDYDELEALYGSHIDSDAAPKKKRGRSKKAGLSDPPGWGRKIHEAPGERSALFVRSLGNGKRVFTDVVWAR